MKSFSILPEMVILIYFSLYLDNKDYLSKKFH